MQVRLGLFTTSYNVHQVFYKQVNMEDHMIAKEDLQLLMPSKFLIRLNENHNDHREPPAALRRHAMKTVQDYLATAPHLFQVIIWLLMLFIIITVVARIAIIKCLSTWLLHQVVISLLVIIMN